MVGDDSDWIIVQWIGDAWMEKVNSLRAVCITGFYSSQMGKDFIKVFSTAKVRITNEYLYLL